MNKDKNLYNYKSSAQPIKTLFEQFFPKEWQANIAAFQKFPRKVCSHDVMGKSLSEYPVNKHYPQILVEIAHFIRHRMELSDQEINFNNILSTSTSSVDPDESQFSIDLTENCKMFLPPPRRHELDIIEKHIALCNNLEFISKVQNPSVVYQYLISLIKNMGGQLIQIDSFEQVVDSYHEYVKQDLNIIIHRKKLK